MPTHAFTIAKLADAAGVNVETIRYYQRRGILDEPPRVDGGFRAYGQHHLRRLQFIRRALDLGFSLDDAAELVALSQSTDRKRLRGIAQARAAEIRQRIADLVAMADALDRLAATCSHTSPDAPCPIVAAVSAVGLVNALDSLDRRDGRDITDASAAGHCPGCVSDSPASVADPAIARDGCVDVDQRPARRREAQ